MAINKYLSRRARSAFKALINTPISGGGTAMPANARLAIRSIAGCAAGVTAGTVVGKTSYTLKTPAVLAANGRFQFYAERYAVVTPAAGFALELDTGLGVFKTIATG